MGDEYDAVAELWAFAARVLQARVGADEDGWTVKVEGVDLIDLTFHRDSGSAAAVIQVAEYDYARGCYIPRPEPVVRDEILEAAEKLPRLAAQAST